MQVASGIQDTLEGSGSTAAAPAAAAVIATIAAPPAGKYIVSAEVHQSGTPDANVLNGLIKAGAASLAKLPTTATSTQRTVLGRVTLDGATALTLNVGAAVGGAGAVYNGSIVADRTA